MSDLQIGLILLGVVLILLVLLFNWWQDRRVRRQMQEQFPEREDDPLLGPAPPPPAAVRREPGLGPITANAGDSDPSEDADDPAEVDPATEVVIDISFAQPVPSEQLHAATHAVRRVGTKPVRMFAEREGGGHRARLRAGEEYASMQLAVLLANRSGPLTEIEWSELWTIAQGIAERFDGSLEGPEQHEVVERAVRLDSLCASLDAMVGLALQLPGALSVNEVGRALEDVGFLRHGKQLAWMSEQGIPRFMALFNGRLPGEVQSAGVDRVEFVLDLPNSPADDQAFSRMASVGRHLAATLNAKLLDDQGRTVAEGVDQAIDQQLHERYQQLAESGFTAGEPRTARLFS
ncbi:MAG TPA: cell division protein ZipA C-terminal FtsZ-binding domain-containing protein [Burkholderiaceae bacterium]|nr:cell division protein ZipA C-terminal FtsZ-binding domain-containing protein [Burkholderiaceae bacterium]